MGRTAPTTGTAAHSTRQGFTVSFFFLLKKRGLLYVGTHACILLQVGLQFFAPVQTKLPPPNLSRVGLGEGQRVPFLDEMRPRASLLYCMHASGHFCLIQPLPDPSYSYSIAGRPSMVATSLSGYSYKPCQLHALVVPMDRSTGREPPLLLVSGPFSHSCQQQPAGVRPYGDRSCKWGFPNPHKQCLFEWGWGHENAGNPCQQLLLASGTVSPLVKPSQLNTSTSMQSRKL